MFRFSEIHYFLGSSSFLADFLNDFVCGSASGVGTCLSGFVLDTAKVKMQVERVGMLRCLLNTVQKEGFLGLYRGVYYPLLTNPMVTALNFGVYEVYKKFKGQKELSFTGGLEAGAFSGLIGSALVSPVEMVKCTMQTS